MAFRTRQSRVRETSRGWVKEECGGVRLSPGVRFGLRFFACLLLFSVVFWAFSLHEHLGPVQRTIAALSALGARLAGGDAAARGDDVVVRT